ncbi:MAG: hypothetical protein RIT43_872 [Bacteroidota bacterium]
MADKGNIEDILREKLNGFEPTVDPAVWNAVSSQITPLVPVATGGFSLIKTAIIGLASTVLAGAVIWFSVNSKGENVRNKPDNKPKTESNQINSDIKSTEETIQDETGQIPGQQLQNNTVAPENNQSQQVKSNVLLEDLNLTPSVETVSLQTNRETNTVQDLPSPAETTTELPVKNENVQHTDEQSRPEKNESSPSYSFVLPNIFTPNSDGSNDVFTLSAVGLNDFNLVILNSRNQVVFTSSDPSIVWDGLLLSGEPAPDGTYIYYFTARSATGEVVTRSSELKMVR